MKVNRSLAHIVQDLVPGPQLDCGLSGKRARRFCREAGFACGWTPKETDVTDSVVKIARAGLFLSNLSLLAGCSYNKKLYFTVK